MKRVVITGMGIKCDSICIIISTYPTPLSSSSSPFYAAIVVGYEQAHCQVRKPTSLSTPCYNTSL